jgi:hypothetical protein
LRGELNYYYYLKDEIDRSFIFSKRVIGSDRVAQLSIISGEKERGLESGYIGKFLFLKVITRVSGTRSRE